MKKLTQREKTLLTILFTGLILVVGIIYWIMPMMSDVETLGYEKNDLETKQTDMEVKIAQTTKLLANKEETENEVEAMMARMSDPLLGEVFDLEVQKLARDNRMDLLSINYYNIELYDLALFHINKALKYDKNNKRLLDNKKLIESKI